jgi:hypothetical protein
MAWYEFCNGGLQGSVRAKHIMEKQEYLLKVTPCSKSLQAFIAFDKSAGFSL